MKRVVGSYRSRDNSKHSDSVDMDPFSMSIIEELLANKQWNGRDQMIKLTFRALTDVIQVHSESIKDLKAIITTRASKQEVTAGLAIKANVLDVSRVVEEISSAVDTKIAFSDIQPILKQYALKKELHQVMIRDGSVNFQQRSNDNVELQAKVLQARLDDFQKQTSRRLGACVSLSQFQELINIVEQKVNISQLNQVLENRVTKQYLSTCLQKKASKADLQHILSKKADVNDIQLIISSLQMKASLPTIQKLTQIIQNKADRSDILILSQQKKNAQDESQQKIYTMKNEFNLIISDLRKQTQNMKFMLNEGLKLIERENESSLRNLVTNNDVNVLMNQLRREITEQMMNMKINIENLEKDTATSMKYENFKRQLTNQMNLRRRCEEKIYEEIDDVRKRIEEVGAKGLEKTEFFNFRSELAEEIDQKIETEHVQEAFNKWEVEISQKMDEDKQELYVLIQRIQKTLTESIAQNTTDILNFSNNNGKKQNYLDPNVVEEIVRKNRKEIEECRRTVDVSYGELRTKIDISEYEADLLDIRKKFDVIEREMLLKANIKDVCVLADSKPNIEDVNKALKQIKSVLDVKASDEDLQDIVKDQASINETLLCQNIVGRWLWQSGAVRPGGLVPWQIEYANTVPDYYFWDKDKSSVLVLVNGIYEITACIFGRNASPVLLVNGESINGSILEQNSNTLNANKKITKRKKDKDLLGYKIQEFINLPARSRISVSVPIEGHEGLLNIRRL